MSDYNEELMWRFMAMHRRIRDLKVGDVQKHFSISEFITLCRIYGISQKENDREISDRGVSMKRLSEGLKVSPAMVTKTVTALEEKGCVKRACDSSDRRGVKVCLTEKGYNLWVEEYEFRGRFFRNAFNRLGREKTEQLFSLSEELSDLLEDEIKNYQNRKGL